ncbi:hypothetical protein HOLleu_27376 [Holothuria leucospilota]|uniref:C2H2-type domain-containing protein n=2 Tax=Holothuria leucospilota TaxID=206669 RepID=A0A9Q1BQQ6_HOLLE|nr:hypothetical protein HOLleu_27376 [Holothuria leucospilota]
MYLNYYEGHFSYIKDMEHYSHTFSCTNCKRLFKRYRQLQKHIPHCKTHVKYRYPGGVFELSPSVYDRLEAVGIVVNPRDRFYPYRITYDIETYLDKEDVIPSKSAKLNYIGQHKLLSISVCSNVPGYKHPQCFISDGNDPQLVDNFVTYLTEISQAAFELLSEGGPVSNALQSLKELVKDYGPMDDDPEGSESGDDVDCEDKNYVEKVLKPLLGSLLNYCRQIPVVGFNSGKYDINVMKGLLYSSLEKNKDDDTERPAVNQIIKRCSDYLCISTKWLKFLDIKNYLAPGCSYSQFLKAYKCQEQKGFFPYDWMDSLLKLEEPSLPSKESFHNELKEMDLTDEEYRYCQKVWKDQNMQTFKDFLVWYNNKDVVPFLEALDKMFAFYRAKDIDMFKQGISVPGLTLRYLFKDIKKDVFCLFPKNDRDLYHLFKDNIVGGPSIIFHRYQERDQTKIRNGKMCKKILGFDANALYLWAVMQDMPTGIALRRKEATGFQRMFTHNLQKTAVGWLEWEAKKRGIKIKHVLNGKEVRVGGRQLPVDGFSASGGEGGKSIIFQFQGCYWHGHPCKLNEGKTHNEKRDKPLTELFEETQAITEYLKSLGFEFVEMWECEWRSERRKSLEIRQFLQDLFPYPCQEKFKMTEQEILNHIKSGDIFGVVECDITVPDTLKPHFAEMPPIFKNIEVGIEDIGDHMAQHAKRCDALPRPRRTLIGSMCGTKVLLATPLLRWYLEHGLVVTKIHQIAQFLRKAVFEQFGEEVSNARREGDKDPSKSIIADTMKLIGNSAYGKTVTNKERQLNVQVCTDDKIFELVNDPFFKNLTPLVSDIYEVDLHKRVIELDLPIQIGFFVYQYAKLRMLEFYYDFMIKFVHPEDFEYCEMDTDSAYLAISGDSLDDVIKPDMRNAFELEKHLWFPRTDTDEHKQHDKRTPGLFKLEWEGDGIVALNSKCYYCFGSEKEKVSCKGVNSRSKHLTKENYLKVLRNCSSVEAQNMGFRLWENQMQTYIQEKTALSYLYIKRKVNEDGVSTRPLDV